MSSNTVPHPQQPQTCKQKSQVLAGMNQ